MRYAVITFWMVFLNGAGASNKNVFPISQRYFAEQSIWQPGAD